MIHTPTSDKHSAYPIAKNLAEAFSAPARPRLSFSPALHPGWQRGLNPILTGQLPASIPAIIAVGGGKGGVGKSMLAANLAIYLQQRGLRCLALDMDLGSSNLHTYFGMNKPAFSLSDAFQHEDLVFSDLVAKTNLNELFLMNAGELPAIRQMDDPQYAERFQWLFANLLQSGETHGIDLIILDLGAGNHSLTMDFFAMAQLGIIVSQSEVSSVENAYAFLKAHLWQIYENVIKSSDHAADLTKFRYLFQKFKPQHSIQEGGGYPELLQRLKTHYSALGENIASSLASRKIALVMNQTRSSADTRIGKSMEDISRSYFGLPASHVATLSNDDLAWKALRSRTSLMQYAPFCQLSRHIKTLADQLLLVLEDHKTWTN